MAKIKDLIVENINILIADRGLKNKDMAELLKCTDGYISGLRHGKKSIGNKIIRKLASVFGVQESDLVSRRMWH